VFNIVRLQTKVDCSVMSTCRFSAKQPVMSECGSVFQGDMSWLLFSQFLREMCPAQDSDLISTLSCWSVL